MRRGRGPDKDSDGLTLFLLVLSSLVSFPLSLVFSGPALAVKCCGRSYLSRGGRIQHTQCRTRPLTQRSHSHTRSHRQPLPHPPRHPPRHRHHPLSPKLPHTQPRRHPRRRHHFRLRQLVHRNRRTPTCLRTASFKGLYNHASSPWTFLTPHFNFWLAHSVLFSPHCFDDFGSNGCSPFPC